MFDQETAQFFHLLRSNTIGDSSSIGLRSVLESNIPASVKTFFRADVEWLRTQEKLREVRSSKFAYTIPEVRLLEDQIDILLVNNYTFTRKDFEAAADKCIHFLLNYLCRPQWTLSSFFFDASIRITTEEMLAKLRYCTDYSYFRAVLEKYVESRDRTDVGSEEMKRLLKTIDEEICANSTPQELAAIARPIFEFVALIRASMKPPQPARVPIRALIIFFEDKKLAKYAEALTALRELDNTLELTIPMLEMVLEAAASGSTLPDIAVLAAIGKREEEFSAAQQAAPSAPVSYAAEAYRSSEPTLFTQPQRDAQHDASIPAVVDNDAGELPMPSELAESEGSPEFADELAAQMPLEDLPEDTTDAAEEEAIGSGGEIPEDNTIIVPDDLQAHGETDEDNVHRMMYERQAEIVVRHGGYENLPSDTEPPVEEHTEPADEPAEDGPVVVAPPYFSEADRQAIVTTLFGGNEPLFDEAINEAANARTWDEAIISLDRFFAEHGIDPFSKEAMMFANILESWHRTLGGTPLE